MKEENNGRMLNGEWMLTAVEARRATVERELKVLHTGTAGRCGRGVRLGKKTAL